MMSYLVWRTVVVPFDLVIFALLRCPFGFAANAAAAAFIHSLLLLCVCPHSRGPFPLKAREADWATVLPDIRRQLCH